MNENNKEINLFEIRARHVWVSDTPFSSYDFQLVDYY